MGTSLFAAQVRHLCSHYRVTIASELLGAIRDRRRGNPFAVAITFDDDLPTHAAVVVPILASAGATATFFLSGASLQGPYRFWWERLQAAVDRRLDLASLSIATPRRATAIHELGRTIETLPPTARRTVEGELERIAGPDPPDAGLRAEHLQRLVDAGVEIGFHTRRHELLPLLDDEDLARAMDEGRGELTALVGRPLTSIAYPHGGADTRVAAAARSAGFEAGFTGRPGIVTSEADPLLLPRLNPSYSSLGEFAFDVAWTIFRATAQR
jgi:peptidoglycan/xylan/chitin deacetylase (PgdA/CDA1 family)